MDWYQRALDAADAARTALGVTAVDAAVVLGSGWGPAVTALGEETARVPMTALPHFCEPSAPGHAGTVAIHRLGERQILVVAGRSHVYERRGPGQVVHAVRTAAALGARAVVLTNANGSLRHDWPLGKVVALSDHINLTGLSPLEGPRFVDLTDAYDPDLRAAARDAARELLAVAPGAVAGDAELPDAVYAMFPGPHFETAAEAHAVERLGAQVLGMSTALETIAAREAGMRVLALSIITAHEAGGEEIDPWEVVEIAERSAARLGPVLARLLADV